MSNPNKNEQTIATVDRDDIRDLLSMCECTVHVDTDNISDEALSEIADRMGDMYYTDTFYDDLYSAVKWVLDLDTDDFNSPRY